MVFNATFNNILSYIVAVSFIGGGPGENHRPPASHRQITVVLLVQSASQTHNISDDRHRLHR